MQASGVEIVQAPEVEPAETAAPSGAQEAAHWLNVSRDLARRSIILASASERARSAGAPVVVETRRTPRDAAAQEAAEIATAARQLGVNLPGRALRGGRLAMRVATIGPDGLPGWRAVPVRTDASLSQPQPYREQASRTVAVAGRALAVKVAGPVAQRATRDAAAAARAGNVARWDAAAQEARALGVALIEPPIIALRRSAVAAAQRHADLQARAAACRHDRERLEARVGMEQARRDWRKRHATRAAAKARAAQARAAQLEQEGLALEAAEAADRAADLLDLAADALADARDARDAYRHAQARARDTRDRQREYEAAARAAARDAAMFERHALADLRTMRAHRQTMRTLSKVIARQHAADQGVRAGQAAHAQQARPDSQRVRPMVEGAAHASLLAREGTGRPDAPDAVKPQGYARQVKPLKPRSRRRKVTSRVEAIIGGRPAAL